MAVRPLRWTDLKKVSGAQVQLTDALFELLPATSARDRLNLEIRKILLKHLGERSFYYLDSVTTESYGSFLSALPDTPLLAVIDLQPAASKLIIHMDNNLAFLLIDKLLGGGVEPPSGGRPLSETEQGVLQYLVMQVLSQVWHICGEASRLHFRFERFYFNVRDIDKVASNKDSAVVLAYKIGIGDLSGFVKMAFTEGFVERASALKGAETKGPEMSYFKKRIDNYDYIRTSLWAEGGRASVPSQDILGLEEGDVILFDETGLSLKEGSLSGAVDLRIGRGEEGCIRASAVSEGKKLKCTLISG